MALFQYQGRNPRGELVKGNLEAGSSAAVATQLFNSGITPIDISLARAASDDVFAALRRRFNDKKPQLSDLTLFSRQMYTLTKSGVPIIQALRGLVSSTRNTTMVRTLTDIAENLEGGHALSSALGRHPQVFTSLIISMVQVGENTGRLDEAFLEIAKYLELEKDTRERVKSALRYPLIVLAAISVAIAIINLFVIPAFAKLFAGFKAELPWATQVLIGLSNFFVAYWPYLVTFLILGYFGLRAYLKTDEGRYLWDRLKLKLPVVGGIIQRATLARFARSFAMAARAGVPLIQALTVVARAVDNSYVSERVLSMRMGVERGETLTRTATLSGLFTPLVLQMLAVGEETGAVDTLLAEVADSYEREVDYEIKNLSASIEPIMLVVIGVMVLILALGVYLPMWDLSNAASGGH